MPQHLVMISLRGRRNQGLTENLLTITIGEDTEITENWHTTMTAGKMGIQEKPFVRMIKEEAGVIGIESLMKMKWKTGLGEDRSMMIDIEEGTQKRVATIVEGEILRTTMIEQGTRVQAVPGLVMIKDPSTMRDGLQVMTMDIQMTKR
jgi:hypothetical protein